MPLEFIISSKGRSILVHDGYEFWLKKKSLNGNMNWRCTKHQSLKCPVTLLTTEHEVIKQLSTHNHECNIEKALAKNAVGRMKERMTELITSPGSCSEAVNLNLPPSVLMALPSKSAIERTLYRHRGKLINRYFMNAVNFTTLKTANFPSNENVQPVKCFNGIKKSPEDKRCYRGLELSNKLKVLLISDPDTINSAAAINVAVGYLSDPDDVPGLAHFCEHMLFLGTEKYPDENNYGKHVMACGGQCNASTRANSTDYYFSVLPEHLESTLDRFAQFFLCPLFTESAIEREIKAVHSEFEKNIPIDEIRVNQIERQTSKEYHPYRKFGTGNYTTLATIPKERGINIKNELLKFHGHWYSANIMTLVVLGKESLDELEQMVTPLFSNVPNKNVEKPQWDGPFDAEHLQLKTYVVPIKSMKKISLTFPAPDYQKLYKSQPFHYLGFLIGHEGSGSLLSALKARGWCNSLACGYYVEGNGFGFFNVKADLTEDGFYHVDDIVTLFFQYINMLKQEQPKKWLFGEIQTLNEMSFRFKEKESPFYYVKFLSHCLQQYPFEDVLEGPYLYDEWKPNYINDATELLHPKNVRVTVIGQQFESFANQIEPWYGTKFAIERIPSSTIKKWEESGLCKDLKLPVPNSFITSNFKILPCNEKETSPYPSIIYTSPISRVWFKQDDEFLLPKANLLFEFVSPLANLDPVNFGLTHLFVQLLKDALNEYDYDAELAGLSWNISKNDYGITLLIDGFNDKQGVLLDKILDKMTNFQIDPQRFQHLKETYVKTLKNFEAAQPYTQASHYLSLLLAERGWMKNDLVQGLDYLTVERLQEFIPQLLSKVYVECLFHGNIDKEGAFKLIEIFENKFNGQTALLPIFPGQLLKKREIELEDGAHFAYEESNKFFTSSCIGTYYQCDVLSTKNDVLMELLVQIIQNPCFDTLRTKEQLGYVVLSNLRRSHCVQGLQILVQSDHHPLYVDQRIEAFLLEFRNILESMSQEEFQKHRESLVAIKLLKPPRLWSLTSTFWKEITSQQYHFDRKKAEVAYLRTITKEQLLEFFDDYMDFRAPHRRKLSVHVLGKGTGGAGNEPPPDAETLSKASAGLSPSPPCVPALKIEDIIKFRSSHRLYPLAQPYMNINTPLGKSKL